MAKARLKISAKPGKNGTKIAGGKMRINKSPARGDPVYRTRAQISVHLEKRNGESRQ